MSAEEGRSGDFLLRTCVRLVFDRISGVNQSLKARQTIVRSVLGGKMKKIQIIQMLVLTILLFVMVPRSLDAQGAPVTLGVTTRTGTTGLPFIIAEEKGFFKSEGINGVVVVMQNQVVVNGVVTRNVDYGGTFSNFIGAALSGLPVRIVMSVMDGSDHYLVNRLR